MSTIPPRPKLSDKSIWIYDSDEVNSFITKIADWYSTQYDLFFEIHFSNELFINALLSCHSNDGYALAKMLDDQYYFHPDSELVDLLDEFSDLKKTMHSKAIVKWVQDNKLVLPTDIFARRFRHGNYDWIVNGIDPQHYQVTIAQPSYQGKSGWHVDYETLHHVE
jgi:hypothetical protein